MVLPWAPTACARTRLEGTMRLPFPLLADEDGTVTREWYMACER